MFINRHKCAKLTPKKLEISSERTEPNQRNCFVLTKMSQLYFSFSQQLSAPYFPKLMPLSLAASFSLRAKNCRWAKKKIYNYNGTSLIWKL